jgi:hypothetical protein
MGLASAGYDRLAMNPRRPVLKARSKQLSERDRQTASAALDLAQNGVEDRVAPE